MTDTTTPVSPPEIKSCRTCKNWKKVMAGAPTATYQARTGTSADFQSAGYDDACYLLAGETDPVTGDSIIYIRCDAMRLVDDLCGWNGKNWEEMKKETGDE